MPSYKFLHILRNVLVQIANKMGLKIVLELMTGYPGGQVVDRAARYYTYHLMTLHCADCQQKSLKADAIIKHVSNQFSPFLFAEQKVMGQNCPCTIPWRPKHFDPPRLQHTLDGRLTDDGEVARLKRRLSLTPKMIPSNHSC
jgi:hypothetical protein